MRVLITGASGNLGEAVCRAALAAGCQIVASSRRQPQAAIQHWVKLDLRAPLAGEKLVAEALSHLGAIDLCVLAHGRQQPARLTEIDEGLLDELLAIDLLADLRLTQALLRQQAMASAGLIVYCSSIQAAAPRAGRGLYGICKAGIEVLAKTVNQEAAPAVRAVALRLGHLDHPMRGVQVDPVMVTGRQRLGLIPCQEVAALILQLPKQIAAAGVLDLTAGAIDNVW